MVEWTPVSFDSLPGFGRFFIDYAGNHLPATLKAVGRPDMPGVWEERTRGGPPPAIEPDLAAALEMEHRRLGASPASLASLGLLASGRTWAVITGQQPGLFGGPLYTWLKIATTVALARRISEVHGIPAVPMFWNGADDADFDEVASTQVPRPDLSLLRFSIPSEEHHSRAWVGDISGAATETIMAAADLAIGDSPATLAWRAWRERTRSSARDFGDWTTAYYLDAFAADGLVVVDARLPEIRRAARPLFVKYLERHAAVRAAVVAQGEALEREGYTASIPAETAGSALFITPDRERLRLGPEETLSEALRLVETHPGKLSPNVILRPIVADSVFPTLAHVAGPSEVAYLSQLAPAFTVLDRPPPVIADRLSITLLPGEALEVARDLGLRPQDLLVDPADALRRWYEKQTPPDLDHALNQGRGSILTTYEVIRESSKTLDASLPQMVDSALEKSLFQLDRLREGVFKKLKHRRELASPRYRHLPDFLAPRRRSQEREIGALALQLLLGGAAREAVNAAARRHVDGMADGQRSHFLGNF